jgi:pyridoxal phosphate enzyme (YggS family)
VIPVSVEDQYRRVAAEVAAVCEQCGREPSDVRLIAVSKTVGPEGVAAAMEVGARDFGENRPDQLVARAAQFPEVRWHFIGNIQSRRIPDIVGAAALIHSLHTLRHGQKINEAAARLGTVQDVLVEVNVSGEASKSGVAPQEALMLVRTLAALPHLRVRGLMTMAPQGDPAAAEAAFRGLAVLAGEIRSSLGDAEAGAFTELSMGMSEDWPCAIACGATMVRVGRAIFSDSFEE